MFSKLGKLCRYLSYRVPVEKDPIFRFLCARDAAYFTMLGHPSSKKGGGFDLLTANRVFGMAKSEGIFVSQVAGKVASLDNTKNFTILPSKDADICPIRHFGVTKELRYNIGQEYLFRIKTRCPIKLLINPLHHHVRLRDLKLHLKDLVLNLYEGETKDIGQSH